MYPIYFSTTDLESDITNYTFQVSNGNEGLRTELSSEKIELLLNKHKLDELSVELLIILIYF